MNKNIPQDYNPTIKEVNRYIQQWNGLDNYVNQEKALDYLFIKLCPTNEKLEKVLLKIATLNDFYSTNIFSVHSVAKHFMSIVRLDERLQSGDETLVDELALVKMGNGKEKHFFSFATKFCSHHNSPAYPIYDTYVGHVLKFFRRCDDFAKFKNKDLMSYPRFKAIVDKFRDYYGLTQFDFKEIDKYLWQLGKEYFPKSYK